LPRLPTLARLPKLADSQNFQSGENKAEPGGPELNVGNVGNFGNVGNAVVMPWLTGVELGPESCVLARVRTAGDRVQLSAVGGRTDQDWDSSGTLVQNLATARRRGQFPRRARVVVWGLHESAAETDAVLSGLVSPLREAGFTIDAVMTPAQALTVLSSRWPRRSQDAMVWLALNRHGAAIAIVASGRLVYSREFDWHYRPATTVREELLQRYSLVAHLAPEIRHGLDVVGAEHGAAPGGIVTCGDLPELRSLTMPLIEELDIEVETLDTLEDLDLHRSVDRAGPHAPRARRRQLLPHLVGLRNFSAARAVTI